MLPWLRTISLFSLAAMSLASSSLAKSAVGAGRRGVVWFKDSDLRLRDHRALVEAHRTCEAVDHVYCFDARNFKYIGGVERVSFRRLRFLTETINDLSRQLRDRGSSLRVIVGRPEAVIPLFCSESSSVFCSEEVCSEELGVVGAVTNALRAKGASLKAYWSGYLVDKDDLPFPISRLDTFTSFRKAVESTNVVQKPSLEVPPMKPPGDGPQGEGAVDEIPGEVDAFAIYEKLMQELGMPLAYDLATMQQDPRAVLEFKGGETAALERVEYYCSVGRIDRYKQTRNGMVGGDFSTKLSPWLALGAISGRSVYHRVKQFEKETGIANEDTYWVIFELLWRDYMRFYAIKYGTRMFKLLGAQGPKASGKYPWRRDEDLFTAWATGNTGYPFIDANMRELMLTGFMSNRGRQNVASFLVRDMGLDWRMGARHFERYLLDYDPCSNYGNWQYAAGVGSDPREDRYFNIAKQASSYDPDCSYIKLWCPELKAVSKDLLINPNRLTAQLRSQYGITKETYPEPIVPLKHSDFSNKPVSSKDYDRRSKHGGVPGVKVRR